MGVRIGFIDTTDAPVNWYVPLEAINDSDSMPAGKYGIGIDDGDGGIIVQGGRTEIDRWFESVKQARDYILEHSARPLELSDFVWDAEDQMYLCPRDGEFFEPGDHADARGIVRAIEHHITEAHTVRPTVSG